MNRKLFNQLYIGVLMALDATIVSDAIECIEYMHTLNVVDWFGNLVDGVLYIEVLS